MGSGKLIPSFALLVHADIALPVNPSLSQPVSFLTFNLPIFFLDSAGGVVSKWLCGT